MKALRIDLVFSYWVYAWFILYVFKDVSYSPKFVLSMGLVENAIMLYFMLTYGTSRRTIIYFIIINTIIKVIPLYYVRNDIITVKDIAFTVCLFVIFVIWLHCNQQSLHGNLKLIYDSLLHGKNQTPFMAFINTLKNNFKHLEVI